MLWTPKTSLLSAKILKEIYTETRNGALFEIIQAPVFVVNLVNGREIVELLSSQ